MSSELMQMIGTLRFTREGQWLHEGVVVTHPGIYQFFSKHLQLEQGEARLVYRGKAVRVEVEETIRVVVAIEVRDDGIYQRLNDQHTAPLRLLLAKADGTMYANTVEFGLAILNRSASQFLYPGIVETPENTYELRLNNHVVPISYA